MTAMAQALAAAPAQAFGADSITGVSVTVIVVLVVVGLLIGVFIAKLIVRLIVAVVVVALAIVVWQQRGHIQDEARARACNFNATYFGVHVDPPAGLNCPG